MKKSIKTQRLELIATTEELISAEMNDQGAFSSLLSACIPTSWPPEFIDVNTQTFTLQQLQGQPQQVGWWSWYFVLQGEARERTLVGVGGFKGRPTPNNSVEVGYSVLDEFQKRGYAIEAVASLVQWAFDQGVQSVTAETLPELVASIRVLEKNGFVYVGEGSEEGVILYKKERA